MAPLPEDALPAAERARRLRLVRLLGVSTDAVLAGVAYAVLGRSDPLLFAAIAALLAGSAAGAWILLGRMIARVEAGSGHGARPGAAPGRP